MNNARGFVLAQLLGGLMLAAGLAGIIGYTYISVAKSNTTSQLRVNSGHLLTQAAYTLTTESADQDSDGFAEGRIGEVIYGDGWNIPAGSGAPKTDAWGTPMRYCVWKNGQATGGNGATSSTSPAGRLAGVSSPTGSSLVFAVISAGPDKLFQTTCAEIHASAATPPTDSTPKGDDGLRTMTLSQLAQGVGGTVYFGDPMPTVTALEALPTSAVKKGQIRVVGNTTYINLTGSGGTITAGHWAAVSGSGGGGGSVSTVENYAALPACITPGDMRLALDSNGLFACYGGSWQLVKATGVSNTLATSVPETVNVMKNTVLPSTTIFTVTGGTAPYSYSINTPLISPVVSDTASAPPGFRIHSNGDPMPNAVSNNEYTVTVRDAMGYYLQPRFNLNIIDWIPSDGYGARNYRQPTIAGSPPASCPAGWVGVPTMRIPIAANAAYKGSTCETSGTVPAGCMEVPAFCVMAFPAVQSAAGLGGDTTGGQVRTATASNLWSESLPWTLIWNSANGGSTCFSSNTRDAEGIAVSGARLIRESQWLAIAHNLAGNPANWDDGNMGMVSGNNLLMQGYRDNSAGGPKPATFIPNASSNRRDKLLSTGERIYDIGGHLSQWTFLDIAPSDAGKYTSTFPWGTVAAPFATGTRGMGTYPTVALDYSNSVPARGGSRLSNNNAGAFNVLPSDAVNQNGFRCTK